jgi:predicted CoA-binding protein
MVVTDERWSVMVKTPESVATFLRGKRFAVAGVSRQRGQAANAVFLKLKKAGYEAFPINPMAPTVEGVTCYPEVGAIPGQLDGVVIATAPAISAQIVRQCGDHGVSRVWFHRSFGNGSVSDDAVQECHARGIECIVGGCPLMFCEPVDFGHRCMRWWLQRQGRVPA